MDLVAIEELRNANIARNNAQLVVLGLRSSAVDVRARVFSGLLAHTRRATLLLHAPARRHTLLRVFRHRLTFGTASLPARRSLSRPRPVPPVLLAQSAPVTRQPHSRT
jgi:hypothetical protein